MNSEQYSNYAHYITTLNYLMYTKPVEVTIINGYQTDLAGAKVILSFNVKAVAKRIFEAYDKDRNGIIDIDESG